ncbi:hypothetical protein [Mucisphaera sp.]|uniref:hypothetical protein n=1 Tax=Mucisphaera sp. TaxID=2913024 RepID=UPI003D12CA87
MSLAFLRLGAARRCPACEKTSRIQLGHVVEKPDGVTLTGDETPARVQVADAAEPEVEAAETAVASGGKKRRGLLSYLGLCVGLTLVVGGILWVTPGDGMDDLLVVGSMPASGPLAAGTSWTVSTLEVRSTEHGGEVMLLIPELARGGLSGEVVMRLRPAADDEAVAGKSLEDEAYGWEARVPGSAEGVVGVSVAGDEGAWWTVTVVDLLEP